MRFQGSFSDFSGKKVWNEGEKLREIAGNAQVSPTRVEKN
jgi:hypothetical protein